MQALISSGGNPDDFYRAYAQIGFDLMAPTALAVSLAFTGILFAALWVLPVTVRLARSTAP